MQASRLGERIKRLMMNSKRVEPLSGLTAAFILTMNHEPEDIGLLNIPLRALYFCGAFYGGFQ